MSRRIEVNSETGRLRSVIIGYPDSFVMPHPINVKQRRYHAEHPERPTVERILPEFDAFHSVLAEHGIEVLQPNRVNGVPDQLTPRDIGIVIGGTFVLASMATDCRRQEWRGIEHILDEIPDEKVLRVPEDVVVEGGDVVVDKGHLYVGVSERTTEEGAAFLCDHFKDEYEVHVVHLRGEEHGEDVLHLDCAFVPVGEAHALIYPGGMHDAPDSIRDRYEWIEVTREEQHELKTNVLSISPTTVISRVLAQRVNEELRKVGLEVIELVFADTPKSGGSFRCASLPLLREDGAA